jgi:hypothetical protein
VVLHDVDQIVEKNNYIAVSTILQNEENQNDYGLHGGVSRVSVDCDVENTVNQLLN